MQTIPEQISSAGRAQFQAQLDLFSSIAVATVENTGKLAMYQLDAGREAMDRSCAAWSQMMSAGPHHLFELMSKAQSNFAGMFDTVRAPFAAPGLEDAQEAAAAQGDGQRDTKVKAQPQVVEPHAPQPPLHRTPIAEAASEVAPDGQSAVPLAAAPIPDDGPVTLPKVKPLEAVPPSAHSDGVRQRKGLPRK